MKVAPLLLLLCFMSGAKAEASEWLVDYAHSILGFRGEQSGEIFDGGFKKFEAKISFDPDHAEKGHIEVTIDMASAFAGSDDRDEALPQESWFNSVSFPRAQFQSVAIRKLAPNQYEATGNLVLKGVTRSVVLPFSLMPEGDHWRAKGHLGLKRNDYMIGTGSFANETYVKFPVDVQVDLRAKPLP